MEREKDLSPPIQKEKPTTKGENRMLPSMSDNVNEIGEALAKFQGEVALVAKDSTVKINTKTGRTIEFKYASLEGIRKTIRKPLSDHGLSFSQVIANIDKEDYLITILLHSSGQWLKSYLKIKPYSDLKELGASITYLKRYALSAVLGVVSDDDLDAIADEIEEKVEVISKEQLANLVKLIGQNKTLLETIVKAIRQETANPKAILSDLPARRYDAYVKSITQQLEAESEDN